VNPSFERQLLIYPVAAYRQMAGSAGIHDIDQQIKRLQNLLAERPEQPGLPLPMLPPLGDEAPDPTIQLKYLDFDPGYGLSPDIPRVRVLVITRRFFIPSRD
jgi:hypothetical protein